MGMSKGFPTRLSAFLLRMLLLVAALPLSVFAAEVGLRTPTDGPMFSVEAASNEDPKEVDALVRLAKSFNHGTDINQIATASSSLVPTPTRATGVSKSNDLLAKNVIESQLLGTNVKQVEVLDHYAQVQMPVYKTVNVEGPAADSAD